MRIIVAAIAALAISATAANAQSIQRTIQDIAKKNDANAPGGPPGAKDPAGHQAEDLIKKLKADSLADLKYAAALADANGNKITSACWHAWVDLLEKYDQPLKDAQGNVLTPPNPDLFTGVEKLSELRQSLQNGGAIQTGCAPLKDAINSDMKNLVGLVLGGGAGLAKLLPIIP